MAFLITFILTATGLNLFAVWLYGSLSAKDILCFCFVALFMSLSTLSKDKKKSKERQIEDDLLYHDMKRYKSKRSQKTRRELF